MASLGPLFGLFLAPSVGILIYLNAANRPQSTRLLWTGSVGITSFIGFSLPALFGDLIHRIYLLRIKPNPVFATPYEMMVLHFSVGVIVSLLAILVYVFGSRNTSTNDDSQSGTC